MDEFLKRSPQNVVSIHCKAGKGRTGTMICCYLLHCRAALTADGALNIFGAARMDNVKGVTIPSQARYIVYYAEALRRGSVQQRPLVIKMLRMETTPHFDRDGGCDPWYTVSTHEGAIYNSSDEGPPKHYVKQDVITFFPKQRIVVQGDVLVSFFDQDFLSNDKMFHFWINTAFIRREEGNRLTLVKSEIDKACKDKGKLFDAFFKVEIEFEEVKGWA
jgi:phosphatidylinositol-3,4,5-trisphosphate 3-phosphatase/dual-specificity protein phosphatase PTEN